MIGFFNDSQLLRNVMLEESIQYQRELDQALINAANNSDLVQVRKFLGKRANPNAADAFGHTALHRACLGGYKEVVMLLLTKGANPNVADHSARTPLFWMCQLGCYRRKVEVAALLLEKGADPNIANFNGITPLHEACLRGYTELVTLLLKQGANVKNDTSGISPLHSACSKGHTAIAALLLKSYPHLKDTIDYRRITPLHEACSKGYIEIVTLLLEKGANPNAAKNDGTTALHLACSRDNTELVTLLLNKGAYLKNDKNGISPLHLVCSKNDMKKAVLLIRDLLLKDSTAEKFSYISEDKSKRSHSLLYYWNECKKEIEKMKEKKFVLLPTTRFLIY